MTAKRYTRFRTGLSLRPEVRLESLLSLETCWETHIDATPLAAAIDKVRLKQLGLDLLQEVAESEATPVEA